MGTGSKRWGEAQWKGSRGGGRLRRRARVPLNGHVGLACRRRCLVGQRAVCGRLLGGSGVDGQGFGGCRGRGAATGGGPVWPPQPRPRRGGRRGVSLPPGGPPDPPDRAQRCPDSSSVAAVWGVRQGQFPPPPQRRVSGMSYPHAELSPRLPLHRVCAAPAHTTHPHQPETTIAPNLWPFLTAASPHPAPLNNPSSVHSSFPMQGVSP